MYSNKATRIVTQKLRRIRIYFKGWGINLRGNTKKKKQFLEEELSQLENEEELHNLSAAQMTRRSTIQKELMDLFVEDEMY